MQKSKPQIKYRELGFGCQATAAGFKGSLLFLLPNIYELQNNGLEVISVIISRLPLGWVCPLLKSPEL